MSAGFPCNPCCPTPEVVETPGSPGTDGSPGAAGASGVNAFTTLAAPLLLPAVAGPVAAATTVATGTALIFGVGQVIYISDIPANGVRRGSFRVLTTDGVSTLTLEWLAYDGDSAGGLTIATGATVSPSGIQPAGPTPIANGGTGVATATLARAALGVGGASLSVYAAGTAYPLTATPALLDFGTTDPSLVIDAPGVWLIMARARIDNNAKTTAAVRTITLKLRRTNNTAADISNSSTSCKTAIMTTLTFTLEECELPPIVYTTTNSDDIIQIWGSADDISGAGTFDAVEASIVAIKLFDQTV